LRAEKFEEFVGMEKGAAEVDIVAGMKVADKAIAPVPPEVRQINQETDAQHGEQARQVPSLGADKQNESERRQQPIGHREFGEQTKAGSDAGGDPPAPAIVFARPDKGIECGGPAQHQRCIGRNDEARD
jgi:hypothetical protein